MSKSEKIRETRLRWLRHVERRCSNEKMEVSGHRKIGIPKLRWSDVTQKDLHDKEVQREEA